jgi:hypothetical protein
MGCKNPILQLLKNYGVEPDAKKNREQGHEEKSRKGAVV